MPDCATSRSKAPRDWGQGWGPSALPPRMPPTPRGLAPQGTPHLLRRATHPRKAARGHARAPAASGARGPHRAP
eukprot:951145-Alexandrium_andersonii.AAC.1